jgi:hypothetical protein
MVGRVLSVVFCACLLLPASLFGQFNLEAPQNGGKESGLGDVHGWKCTGSNFTYTINNSAHIPLAYGISRNDTIGQCGDSNNGFISQQNWNFLPPGQYTLRVFDNGVQFAQATFSVANLGTEFLSGASGTYQLNFAGQIVTIEWQENKQNFVITGASGGGGGGGGGLDDLSSLIGNWLFTYTIISTFTNAYNLQTLTTVSGTPTLIGEDEFGDPVIANKIQDLTPGSPLPYTFALLDPSLIICRFYVFNHPSANVVSGLYIQYSTDASGNCTTNTSGNTYVMTGSRISALMQAQSQADQRTLEQQALNEDRQIQTELSGESDLPELTDLMLQMQQRVERSRASDLSELTDLMLQMQQRVER